MGIDQFHIGPFTVQNQTFGLIKEERGRTFQELPLEGIVGLAFPSMSAGGVKPFFDNVIEQKLLKRNMFAFYLSPSDSHGASSLMEDRYAKYKPGMDAILWGGVDSRLYEGELVWFPVTQAHYWSIDLHGFFIGNQSIGAPNRHSDKDDSDSAWSSSSSSLLEGSVDSSATTKLIVDSGTTYYTAEHPHFQGIMDRLQCDDGGMAPDIAYRLKDVDGKMRHLVLKPEDYMVSKCEPGFLKIAVPRGYGPAMLLGELFMRRFFTVFDRGDGSNENARIGLARARPGAEIGEPITTD
jgi:pepsin A